MRALSQVGWVALPAMLGCARLTLHAARPGVNTAMAPVRFETAVDRGQVRVVTASASGALVGCAPPCVLPLPVGRAEVAVQGPVRFVQGIDVPPAGAAFVLTDRSRTRRADRRGWLIGSGVLTGVGLTGTLVGASMLYGEELSCAIGRAFSGGSSVSCGGPGAGVTITFGALAGIGLVALIVSAISGSAGDPPRLEPLPSLRVGVAPLPGGAAMGVAASF